MERRRLDAGRFKYGKMFPDRDRYACKCPFLENILPYLKLISANLRLIVGKLEIDVGRLIEDKMK